MRLTMEKDRALRDERMAEREEERARHAAAEQASQAFIETGQERFEALRQQMMEEFEELRDARVRDGKGVATLTEDSLRLHLEQETERSQANESRDRVLGRAINLIDAGTWHCGRCKQPSKSTVMCTNTCEGVYCYGSIKDEGSHYIRPPIGTGVMRLPGYQCLDKDTRGLMALGTAKVKALRAMTRKERLEEALRENRKCWACGGNCGQKNPPCAPTCSQCGNTGLS